MKTVRAIASGKVQGVAFRMYTQERAKQLGVVGFVQNLSNGDVKIVAAGRDSQVDALIAWAKTGSPSARVDSLQVEKMKYREDEFFSFEIRR